MAHAGAHAAALAQAVKASGVLVRVEPDQFQLILQRQDEPLVVKAPAGFLQKGWRYLTSFKGLAFVTKSSEPIPLSGRALVVEAKAIWTPS